MQLKGRYAMSIEKLEYRRRFFDISEMRDGARVTNTITNDGVIIRRKYKAASRKVDSVYKTKCALAEFDKLCKEIEVCIENADRLDYYEDGSSEELRIYYKCGRIQIVDRGLGDGVIPIGTIVNHFLDKHLL